MEGVLPIDPFIALTRSSATTKELSMIGQENFLPRSWAAKREGCSDKLAYYNVYSVFR
jgi:hypothetical protein